MAALVDRIFESSLILVLVIKYKYTKTEIITVANLTQSITYTLPEGIPPSLFNIIVKINKTKHRKRTKKMSKNKIRILLFFI